MVAAPVFCHHSPLRDRLRPRLRLAPRPRRRHLAHERPPDPEPGRGALAGLGEAVDAGVDGRIELLDGGGGGRVEALPELREAVVDGWRGGLLHGCGCPTACFVVRAACSTRGAGSLTGSCAARARLDGDDASYARRRVRLIVLRPPRAAPRGAACSALGAGRAGSWALEPRATSFGRLTRWVGLRPWSFRCYLGALKIFDEGPAW